MDRPSDSVHRSRPLQELGMMFGEPLDEKIEPAPSTVGPDTRAPFGPALDELAETQQAHDLTVRRVLDALPWTPQPQIGSSA